MPDLVDLYAPAAPGSLMRSIKIDKAGMWRLARRDCELVCVEVPSAGAFGRFLIMNGKKRPIFMEPSTFTGTFVLFAGLEDGLIVHVDSMDLAACSLTINWREKTTDLV